MGKDISELSEPQDIPKPVKPKLKAVPKPPQEPKPPAIQKEITTINEAYQKMIKKKEFNHWNKE